MNSTKKKQKQLILFDLNELDHLNAVELEERSGRGIRLHIPGGKDADHIASPARGKGGRNAA